MPQTVADIGSWVIRRNKRPDVLEQSCENALNFYKLLCQAVPFEELETTSAERTLTGAEGTHSLSDLNINGIASIRLTTSTGVFRRLRRSHVRVYDSLGSISYNPPATYARWGKAIELNPIPASSSLYTIRLRYWAEPVIAAVENETTIVCPDPWLELVRYETLYRTYMDFEEYEKANMLVAPLPIQRTPSPHKQRTFEYGVIPKLWNDLLRTVKQRENVDEDFSINPLVRRYTFV